MTCNRNRESEVGLYLPKCPKYPPQRTRFDALGQFSPLNHSIALLLIVLLIIGIVSQIPSGPDRGPTNLAAGVTESASALSSSDELADLVYTTDGGFALAITTSFDVTGDQDILLVKTDMNGLVQWSRTYGRLYSHDIADALVQTSDGGYALVGRTRDMRPSYWDQMHLWFIKTDADGNVEWNKTFWGRMPSETIYGYGYVDGIAGIIQNQDGDFILKMQLSTEGQGDHFLVKIDSKGTIEWISPKLPIASYITTSTLIQTLDGGFALAGYTPWEPETGKNPDMFIVKIDSNGYVDWRQTIGGLETEVAQSLVQTADGGFALSGYYGSDEPGASLKWLLMKTDSNGAMKWRQTYHKRGWGSRNTLVQTTDGGFALAGINQDDTYPFPGFVSLVKTNSNGDMTWSQTYADILGDYYHDLFLVQTADRGFALAGTTNDGTDVYLMKIAENGDEEWIWIFDGTSDEDWATDLTQTVDGGFVFTGYMDSQVGLVKTDENGVLIWNHTYKRSGENVAKAVIQTVDGGFVIAGSTSSQGAGNTDAWLIKTDENGMSEWNRTYGGQEDDGAEVVIQTADEGFALAGFTRSYGTGDSDAWLIKTDKNGTIEWNQTYGGELDDKALHLYQLTNGSFAMLGYYNQYYEEGSCGTGGCWHADTFDDAWMLVTDENGLFQQEFVYELPGKVRFHDLAWSDEGIRIIGTSFSQVHPSTGWNDIVGQDSLFLLRMNESGLYEWNNTLSSLSHVITPDIPTSVYGWGLVVLIFTADGGFILSGQFDCDLQPYQSLVKMDSNGLTQWVLTTPMRIIGDSMIIQTADGGYALAGGVFSHGSNGDSADAWLASIRANGTMLWEQTYGTPGGKPHYYSWEGQPYTAATSFSSWFMIAAMLIVVTGIRSNKRTSRAKNKPKKN